MLNIQGKAINHFSIIIFDYHYQVVIIKHNHKSYMNIMI
jgi:hypothetical protein